MELYQLDFFRILCKHGNYTSASEELNVTQPAVSTAIKKLESEFGRKLIDRVDKEFVITKAGEIVLSHATAIHNEVAAMGEELDTNLRKTKELVRFAAPFTMCPDTLIPKLINDFMMTHTDITMNIFQKGHAAIVEGLANRNLEIGIFSKDMASPIFDYKDFISVELVAVFSEDHPFNSVDSVTPEMLEKEKIILSKVPNRVPGYIQRYLRKENIKPEIVYRNVIPPECAKLAAAGGGIALVPERIAGEHYAHLNPKLECELVVGWNKKELAVREIQILADYLTGIYL